MYRFSFMTLVLLLLVLSVAAAPQRALKQAKIKRDGGLGHVAREAEHKQHKPSPTPT
jgi:hypothetical protein